jgi:hypothetical protein
MNYKIYIESLNNFPVADWAVSAYMGFKHKQANIIFFEDIEEVPVSPWNIVVGFIETTNKYFEKLGLPSKQAINIPEELIAFTGRKIFKGHLFDLEYMEGKWPLFIKPDGKAKEFIAGVVRDKKTADLYFNDLDRYTKILCSEVVEFVSEYRTYIINGTIKGIKHYIGDYFIFPDPQRVKDMVMSYKDAPAGYSLDVGITKNGETLLVECNDGWSLGNYGLEDTIYANLLATRWRELMKERKEEKGVGGAWAR